MNRHMLMSAIVAAVFVCSGSWFTVLAEAPGSPFGSAFQCELTRSYAEIFQYDGDPIDREGCQQLCRSIYNVDPYWYGPRSSGRGRGVGYGVCIQKCSRNYWKAWDKDMDDLAE